MTMIAVKPFGPIPRDEFKELVDAPFGEATKRIRKYDPLYGRAEGEKIKWKVTCLGTLEGIAYVEAASEKEANDLACDLSVAAVDWDGYADDFEIISVEVDK